MRVREAKDFLVRHIGEQAQMEGVSLSDLEERMLYFTEGPGATEDPVSMNEEFEGQYDTAKYEKKISNLMHHTYKRLRHEDPSAQQTWDAAIRRLKRGDHYLLVMWDARPGIHAPELIVVAMILFGFAILLGIRWITNQFAPPNPYIILAFFVAVFIACYFFQNQVGKALGWILDKTLFRFMGSEKGGDDSE